jgi:hypothetical protein
MLYHQRGRGDSSCIFKHWNRRELLPYSSLLLLSTAFQHVIQNYSAYQPTFSTSYINVVLENTPNERHVNCIFVASNAILWPLKGLITYEIWGFQSGKNLDYGHLCCDTMLSFITFFYLVCEVIGTAATPGLLCQPRVIVKMIVEKQMECRLAGETEVLGENLPQRHFCPSQNPTWPDPGLNPGCRGGKPATNRLRYGAAFREVTQASEKLLLPKSRQIPTSLRGYCNRTTLAKIVYFISEICLFNIRETRG